MQHQQIPAEPAAAVSDCIHPDDPRRWRDAPLAQRLFIVHNLMMRVGDRLVSDLGLTSSRWLLLGAVARRSEPATLSELSEDALLSLQNVSRMVACMEEDGLLQRLTRPGSGRAVYVRLTDAGRSVHERTKHAAQRFAAAFLAGMTDADIERMEDGLEQLIGNLEGLELELCAEKRAPQTPERCI